MVGGVWRGLAVPSVSAKDVGGGEGVRGHPGRQGLQPTPCDVDRPGVPDYKDRQPVALVGAQIYKRINMCEFILEQVCKDKEKN